MVHDRTRSSQPGHTVATTSIMHITGEIDAASAPGVFREVRRVCWSAPTTLLVDLTGVTFFGAAGLTLLVDIHRQAQLTETVLYLVAPPRIMLLLRITGLDKVFRTRDTMRQARATAQQPSADAMDPPPTAPARSDVDDRKGLLRLVSD